MTEVFPICVHLRSSAAQTISPPALPTQDWPAPVKMRCGWNRAQHRRRRGERLSFDRSAALWSRAGQDERHSGRPRGQSPYRSGGAFPGAVQGVGYCTSQSETSSRRLSSPGHKLCFDAAGTGAWIRTRRPAKRFHSTSPDRKDAGGVLRKLLLGISRVQPLAISRAIPTSFARALMSAHTAWRRVGCSSDSAPLRDSIMLAAAPIPLIRPLRPDAQRSRRRERFGGE